MNQSLAAAYVRIDALRRALEASGDGPVRIAETHISWVLLTPAIAYKLKKPVRLGFLDFRSLEQRRRACEEELRINRRFAPDLYLDLAQVHDGPQGPSFGGLGAVVDTAVRMRRFPDGALWSERVAAGTLTHSHVDSFAVGLADLHREAPTAPPGSRFGSPAMYRTVVDGIVTAIDDWQAALPSRDSGWQGVRDWLTRQLLDLDSHWSGRLSAGHVRECHGDLHLGNVLQAGDDTTAFDALEFDPDLRWIDPLHDLAFVVMDLMAHGRRDLAFRLFNGYLEASGDYDGLPAFRFFLVARALVRAQVCVLSPATDEDQARDVSATGYLELASQLVKERDPRLAIMHGLPGSGKTFTSQGLVEVVGAIRVRSDVERKRAFGLSALESSKKDGLTSIYDNSASQRTYARMLVVARTALEAGWPTIVDAAFLRRAERNAFADLAASLRVPFTILHCGAEPALLRQRIAMRRDKGNDASEADLEVLERLSLLSEPLDPLELELRIPCEAGNPEPPGALARRWQARR